MNMPSDFDMPVERRASDSIKWGRYAGRDVLPLWVADMDFRSPDCIIQALHERVGHGVFGYPQAPDGLREAIAGWLAGHYGWRVEPAWLVWLPGLVTGLNVACRAVGEAGDGVATLAPVYPPFLSAPNHTGRERVTAPMVLENGRWQPDWAALESVITPRTRMLLLCHPHNPVGRVYERDDLERFAGLARRHDLIVCSDEIHCDLVLDPDKPHLPFAALDEDAARRSITLMAPSKTFNVPGLGFSFAVVPDAGLRRHFRQAMAGIVPDVNVLGFAAALAAYREGEPWRRELIAYLRGNRDRVQAAVAAIPSLALAPAEATYLAWIDARGLGLPDPVAHFERHGLGLSDGRDFGLPGFVRLNFGCPRARLDEALARLRRAAEAVE
jgi:cystathionine beta-lyase